MANALYKSEQETETFIREEQDHRDTEKSLPDAEAVRRAGKHYCWRKLGDALGVDLPVWQGDVWVANLLLRDHVGVVGRLVFSRDGLVIAERSSSKAEILEGLDASRADASAA